MKTEKILLAVTIAAAAALPRFRFVDFTGNVASAGERPLGVATMVGKIELPSGFDKLEGEIKWNSLYEEAAKAMANPFKAVQLQCRSSIETYGPGGRIEEVPLATFLTVMFKKNPLGTFKQHDNAEFGSTFTATYIKQVIKRKDVLELDYMANIFKVNGEDLLATYRDNIGG